MKLNFTGRGAMLYPQEGNTAAYFESDNAFFLIDCGEDVAAKLIADEKLNRDKEYYLMVTHTHSDHIGSLGTLQQYLYWCCGKKLNIVISPQMRYQEELKKIIDGFGLVSGTYSFVSEESLDNKFQEFHSIRYVRSNHGDTPLASCAIVIGSSEGNMLYTGDIADDAILRGFITYNGTNNIDRIYTDVSLTNSPVHLSLEQLKAAIPDELKSKVYCMHINDGRLLPLIVESGFQVVSTTRDMDSLTVEELEKMLLRLQSKTEDVKRGIDKKKNIKQKTI